MEAQNAISTCLSDRCILLGGQPRSGTTLLTSILRSSNRLFQAYELHIRKPSFLLGNNNRYTQNIFKELGLPQEEFIRIVKDYSHVSKMMNLGAWVGPKEEVSAEQLTGKETKDFDSELKVRGILTTQLLRHTAELYKCPRWGFKILGDIIHADHYAQVWPNATFILLVRDPRDHAISLMKLNEQRKSKNQNNFYDDYFSLAKGWRHTMQCGKQVLEKNNLKHVILRYEDLVTNTENELIRLSKTLDLDLSEGINFHQQDFVHDHTKRFKHHQNLTNPVNSGSIGKWRNCMNEEEVNIFSEVAGDVMKLYNYLD